MIGASSVSQRAKYSISSASRSSRTVRLPMVLACRAAIRSSSRDSCSQAYVIAELGINGTLPMRTHAHHCRELGRELVQLCEGGIVAAAPRPHAMFSRQGRVGRQVTYAYAVRADRAAPLMMIDDLDLVLQPTA